eukprot:COSAG02_NODE_1462_length_12490_cov_71.373820_3_plen_52_part_00
MPRPLEALVGALGGLGTEGYVVALKAAALHLQVRERWLSAAASGGGGEAGG